MSSDNLNAVTVENKCLILMWWNNYFLPHPWFWKCVCSSWIGKLGANSPRVCWSGFLVSDGFSSSLSSSFSRSSGNVWVDYFQNNICFFLFPNFYRIAEPVEHKFWGRLSSCWLYYINLSLYMILVTNIQNFSNLDVFQLYYFTLSNKTF